MKKKIVIALLGVFFVLPVTSHAAMQSLNGLGGQDQTLATTTGTTTMHMKVVSSGTSHSFQWDSTAWRVDQGGTGATAFTTGSVLFAQSSSISQDNANFFWNAAARALGIRNSSPITALDVSGTIYSRLVTATSSNIYWNSGNVHSITLSPGNTSLTFVGGTGGAQYSLIVNQNGSGGGTITWPSSVIWKGGQSPTLTSAANSIDVINFVHNGTKFLGSYNLDYREVSTSTLANNLVSYWKLDGDSSDSADSNNGSDTNLSYSVGNGKINSGAGFNGTSSVISYGNPSNLQATSSLSISFWLKLDNVNPSGVYGLVNKTNDASQRSYGIWYNNPGVAQGLIFQMSSNGSDPNTYSWTANSGSANPEDTDWHHYVFTFNSNGGSPIIVVYKDGTNVTNQGGANQSSQSWSGTSIFNSSSNVVIGDKSNFSWPLGGSMDEVGIWTRVLTAQEASDLYNSGNGLQYPF